MMEQIPQDELSKDPDEVFMLQESIGEGSYGVVYKSIHSSSGTVVAVKRMLINPNETSTKDIQQTIKEICILQQCKHPNVVKYFASYFKEQELWIVMEYCGAGSVADILRVLDDTMTEAHMSAVLEGTLLGLRYLHTEKKIHRDIKAGNILLDKNGVAKLGDLGVVGELHTSQTRRNTVIGTPFWMAPEVISAAEEGGYDVKADIWSLGITVIEMAEGRPPLADVHPMRAIFMIPAKPPPTFSEPDKWGQPLQNFLGLCLLKDPNERASASKLLETAFIKSSLGSRALLDLIERVDAAKASQDAKNSDREENFASDAEDTGTMVPSSLNGNSDATMVLDGTMKVAEMGTGVQERRNPRDNTMVMDHTMVVLDDSVSGDDTVMIDGTGVNYIGDDFEGTGVQQRAGSGNTDQQPEFMKHMKAQDENDDNHKQTETSPWPAYNNSMPAHKLETILQQIKDDMASEISKVKNKYKAKRSLIEQAIMLKKKTADSRSKSDTKADLSDLNDQFKKVSV
eukprot:m.110924 g.110924  ORF g.110924 m.110924 type:complete len:513 (+) comp14052_c0_seq2:396-1934(+)